MEARRPHSSVDRAEPSPFPEVRASPLAPGAPNPAPGAGGNLDDTSPDLASQGREAVECESWVREKVLFLLHPERWLGTLGEPACEEGLNGEDLPQVSRDSQDGEAGYPSPFLPEERTPGRRLAAAPGAQPRDSAASPRPVLVRVVDYQVTQEVLRTAWTKGRMTTRTEERCVTAVTFRTHRD